MFTAAEHHMMTSDVDALPSAGANVMYRSLSDGGVLFSVQDEVYFGLNVVGAHVWEALPPVSLTLGALCTRVQAEYPDVDPALLRSDIIELLDELERHGLVTPAVTPAAGPVGVPPGAAAQAIIATPISTVAGAVASG